MLRSLTLVLRKLSVLPVVGRPVVGRALLLLLLLLLLVVRAVTMTLLMAVMLTSRLWAAPPRTGRLSSTRPLLRGAAGEWGGRLTLQLQEEGGGQWD